MRRLVSSVLEVGGSVAVTVGAWSWSAAAGWIVGGVFALWFARGLS